MAKSVSKAFPKVKFYDQDLVDLYNKTWILIKECWKSGNKENGLASKYFSYSGNKEIYQFESILSTFFLVYSNKIYPVTPILDNFYSKQEASGAIRCAYNEETGKPVKQSKNPEMVHPPLFAWAEYNIYHKLGLKSRVKDIVPVLEKYYFWLEKTFKKENGLYAVPLNGTTMENAPRSDAYYPIDFNCQQAINALYMSALGEIMNDKERSYRFKKYYFSLKTRINKLMWNEQEGYYYDLDKKERQVKSRTIASFWPLLAEIANRDKAEKMIDALLDDQEFYTENPFPSVSLKHKHFHKQGMGYRGSVYPHLTFIIIKGLEKYGRFDLAREFAIKHLYSLVECIQSETEENAFWEAYSPTAPVAAKWPRHDPFPRKNFLTTNALSTITLMIENIIGFYISLPRKTIDWIVPQIEAMGIEDLSLKRNLIKIVSSQSGRGWEIRLESEKLYYFTINILGEKKRTLPIPSGKCSILIDKL